MISIPPHWHIDCPFKDVYLSDPLQPTLRAEFVVHMGRVHGANDQWANTYFTENCHQ